MTATAIRALTVQQPWVWAIAHLGKNVENRPWETAYRGPVAIHAGKAWDPDGATDRRVLDHIAMVRRDDPRFIAGAVIAIADLVDCHPAHDGCCAPWGQPRQFHFVLANVRRLDQPVQCRGWLGLWILPDTEPDRVAQSVAEQIKAVPSC